MFPVHTGCAPFVLVKDKDVVVQQTHVFGSPAWQQMSQPSEQQPDTPLASQPSERNADAIEGDLRCVKEIPLTAHDHGIVRELWVRSISHALYGSNGTPKDQRVLDVWTAWCGKQEERKDFNGQPTFCGFPLDLVQSPGGLEKRWELALPVWEAACNATRVVRRYIRIAADAAVTAGYVPTRAGILDPLLRDPLQVLELAFHIIPDKLFPTRALAHFELFVRHWVDSAN